MHWSEIISFLEQNWSGIAILIVAVLNLRTLKEMERGRIETVTPLLMPELYAKAVTACDLKLSVDCSSKPEGSIELRPFTFTLTNIGKGPACNIVIYRVNKYMVPRNKIKIIRVAENKIIQLLITMDRKKFKPRGTIDIEYEDLYGHKYEQSFDFMVNERIFHVDRIYFNRPKEVKRKRSKLKKS